MKINRSNIILYLSIGLLFFHLTSSFLIANAFVGLLILAVFLDKEIGVKLKLLTSSKKFWVLISLFLLFVASVFYSTDPKQGWKVVEIRLSLLLFPIIYGIAPLQTKQIQSIYKIFISLVCLIPLIGVFTQWGKYIDTGDTGWFYNDNIVQFVNKQAVYFAMYINIALTGLFYFWYNEKVTNKFEKVISAIVLIFLITGQYLLASRTSILTMVLLIAGFVAVLIINKINRKQTLILLTTLTLLVISLVLLFPKVLKRFDSITQTEYQFNNTNPINHFNGEIKKENWNGLNTRIALWTCAIDEIKKRPLFGSGIGDVQNNLMRNYSKKEFILAIQSGFNCHNQYLDVLLSNGVSGLIIFFIWIGYIIIISIKHKNGLLLGLIAIFVIACLTENVLGRNQGVVFVSLMIAVNIFKRDKHVI